MNEKEHLTCVRVPARIPGIEASQQEDDVDGDHICRKTAILHGARVQDAIKSIIAFPMLLT